MTKQGFNTQLHRQTLIKLLVDIFKELKGKIGFKGGTCAFLFYNLPRVSLDLDFDILEPLTKEDIDSVRVVLEKHGTMKQFQDKRFTTFFLFDYQTHTPNIKIELNKRILQNNKYKTILFSGVEMKIVDKATLFTNKLVALSNRKGIVARDLFDVYYFLQLGLPLNEKLIKEQLGKSQKDYLKFLIGFIEKNFNDKNILHGLGEVLDNKQKQWAKENIIKETIKLIKSIK